MNVISLMSSQDIFNICIFVGLKVTEGERVLQFYLHVSIVPLFDPHEPFFNFAEI